MKILCWLKIFFFQRLIARFRPLISQQKDAEKAAKASGVSADDAKEEQKESKLPLKGVVAEEQAPPPAAAP